MLAKNNYAGNCHSCRIKVAANAGYRQKINGKWSVWCNSCVPVKKTSERREIVSVHGEGRLYMPYEPENLSLVRSMPGARWISDKNARYWRVSLLEQDRIRLLEIADKLNLKVDPSLRQLEQTVQAENAKESGLYDYQIEGVNWLSMRQNGLLGDEMGLGKTVQVLMSLDKDSAGLVVAPAGLVYNWKDEVQKWRPEFRAEVISGSKKNFRFPEAGEILITSYGSLPAFLTPPTRDKKPWREYAVKLEEYREENKILWPASVHTTLMVDEAHKVKNYRAIRSKKIKELSYMCQRTWGMTGTPVEARPEDLYGILESLNLVRETFGGWQKFLDLFDAVRKPFGGYEFGSPSPEVAERLRRVMLRRRRSVVLPQLPSKTYTDFVVDLQDKKIVQELDDLWDHYGTLLSVGELPDFEDFSKVRAKLAENRIPAMLEYVENAEEQDVPLLVFSSHLKPLDHLLTRDGWAIITGDTKPAKRQEIVNAFQAGNLKGVGLSIRAGGTGLTLTRAWKVLFVDQDWNPTSNWQASDRACRIGQTNNVEIVRMHSDHPLDIHVNRILGEKAELIESILETNVSPELKQVEQTETESEFKARMKNVQSQMAAWEEKQKEEQAEKQKERGKNKVNEILNREQERHQKTASAKPMLPLTSQRKQMVKQAFGYMMSVCDGAVSRDNCGFNKPDAMVARYLDWAGLENDQEIQAAYCMITRYYRQLHERWPVLWENRP